MITTRCSHDAKNTFMMSNHGAGRPLYALSVYGINENEKTLPEKKKEKSRADRLKLQNDCGKTCKMYAKSDDDE